MPIPLPSLPENNTSICVVIPDSPEWRQIYIGALVILQQWWYYDVQSSDIAEDVIQRVMQCAYETGLDYEGCQMTCDDVADCIETSQAVWDALQNIGVNIGDSSVASGQWKNDNFVADGGGTCDDALLFGMIDAMLVFFNQYAEDMFEKFEVQTNIVEALGVAEDVPIIAPLLDIIGAELATEYIEFLFDSVAENYLATWTIVLKDQIECDFYCWLKDSNKCEFSITDIAQFFAEKSLTSLASLQTIQDIITYITLGTWSGAEFVYVTFFALSGGLALEKLIAGQNWESFKRAMLIAPPSNEYLACNCGWSSVLDLTIDDYGFTFYLDDNASNQGTWTSGVGLQGTQSFIDGANDIRLFGNWTIDETTITSIRVEGSFRKGGVPVWATSYVCARQSVKNNTITQMQTAKIYTDFPSATTVTYDETTAGNVTSDEIEIFFRPSLQSINGIVTITKITINGTGTKPTQLP